MSSGLIAGIDVGGTKTAAVLMTDTLELLAAVTEPTERSDRPQRAVEHIESLVNLLLRKTHYSRKSLGFLGVGLPGLIAPDRTFRDSTIFSTWRNVNFNSLLSARIQVPTIIDNDATMAAVGHIASISPEYRPSCLVCLTLGTGVGGAILFDGVPLRGADGTAGQIGHLIVDPDGAPCNCGNIGCLNAYASGTALAHRYLELIAKPRGSNYDGNVPVHIGKAISHGDPLARQALAEAIKALVVAISSVVNALNPDMVVLGGGVANLGQILVAPIQSEVSRRSFQAPARRVKIRQAAYGQLSGAIGAAVAAASLSTQHSGTIPLVPRIAGKGDH